jgi:hypothetical protein
VRVQARRTGASLKKTFALGQLKRKPRKRGWRHEPFLLFSKRSATSRVLAELQSATLLEIHRRFQRRGGPALAVFNKTSKKPLPVKEAHSRDHLTQEADELRFTTDYAACRFEAGGMTGTAEYCGIGTF